MFFSTLTFFCSKLYRYYKEKFFFGHSTELKVLRRGECISIEAIEAKRSAWREEVRRGDWGDWFGSRFRFRFFPFISFFTLSLY